MGCTIVKDKGYFALLPQKNFIKLLQPGSKDAGGHPGFFVPLPVNREGVRFDSFLAKDVGFLTIVYDKGLYFMGTSHVGSCQNCNSGLAGFTPPPIFILVNKRLAGLHFVKQPSLISVVDVLRAVVPEELGQDGGFPGIHSLWID